MMRLFGSVALLILVHQRSYCTFGANTHHQPSRQLATPSPLAFCPRPRYHYLRHRSVGRKFILPISLSATTPGSTVLLRGDQSADRGAASRKHVADRKSILLLNRRKLPRQIVKCKADVNTALSILAEAYPHLSLPLEENYEVDIPLQGLECSYERLLNVLRRESQITTKVDNNPIRHDTRETALLDDVLIIDGKSIVATMEVLRKAHNIPAAMHLLGLSVRGLNHNRKLRTKLAHEEASQQSTLFFRLENDNDKNELRRVYKAVLSLLGHNANYQRGGSGSDSNSSPRLIMHLLRHHMPNIARIQPGSEMYHAAMNALGKFGECGLILDMLEEMEHSHELNLQPAAEAEAITTLTTHHAHVPPVDRMAYQTAISSLARHGHCREATQLLYRMQTKGFEQPDMNIYNELLIGIAKEAGKGINPSSIGSDDASVVGNSESNPPKPLHKVALEIMEMMEMCNRQPTAQTYNSVISACVKEGEWDESARVAEKAAIINSGNFTADVRPPKNASTYFENLQCFCKVGAGKDSWWEVGRYSVADDECQKNAGVRDNGEENDKKPRQRGRGIIVGIQPHRNPVYNGLSIVFFDEESRVKLGRMLLKNAFSNQSAHDGSSSKKTTDPRYYSSLVGMEVNKARRGEGLSKIFVAIWLRICLETGAYPRAAVMNKPLIAYVLMGFNFVPQNGGSRVELIRLKNDENKVKEADEDGFNPQFGLYSPSAKSLRGLFSHRVLRTQNIAILDHPPPPASRKNATAIYLKTKFEHPIAIVEHAVEYVPPPLLQIDHNLGIGVNFEEHKEGDDVSSCLSQSQDQRRKTASVQRQLLNRQLHSVLKTNNAEDAIATGRLEFFSNSTLLKRAFLSYVSNC